MLIEGKRIMPASLSSGRPQGDIRETSKALAERRHVAQGLRAADARV